jgi:cytochrome c-type biogenesis protein
MDLTMLRQALEQAGFAAAALSFLAGLFFSINPVAIAAIPVSLAYVTRARERHTAFAFGGMFIAGLVVTHVALGISAGLGGLWIGQALGRHWGAVLGPLLIFLGLLWTGWVRIPLPAASFRARRATGLWGAFALGAPFSLAVCPVCTPALVVLLGAVAGFGSPLFGALALFAFAAGRAVPIAFGAWALGSLDVFRPLARYQRAFDLAGGGVLMLTGLYLLNTYYFFIPALAG